ncbi:DinB family protein [Halobacillus salinarum]|uniref:DinB family protein n=1 Tax=Halobacillus salinarum TaxID=2932257 RepID=A0ABY4EN93_9BACI|nr:DinB family protein [Halobacillus salinarum]UOQ45925.1 DinB family protein [Halobacillus salinarum]
MNKNTLVKSLRGESAHVSPKQVFEDIDWQQSGSCVDDSPYTIWELIWHMDYWQNFILEALQRKHVSFPVHARETWPDRLMPDDQEEWTEMVSKFMEGLAQAENECSLDLSEQFEDLDHTTRLDLLMDLVIHNSYHTGQAVLLRRQLKKWPPPAGGQTW